MTLHLIQVLSNCMVSHQGIYFFVHQDKSTNDRNTPLKFFSVKNIPAAGSGDVHEPTELLTLKFWLFIAHQFPPFQKKRMAKVKISCSQ